MNDQRSRTAPYYNDVRALLNTVELEVEARRRDEIISSDIETECAGCGRSHDTGR